MSAQVKQELMTSTAIARKQVVDLDGFSNFTNEVEGDTSLNVPARSIKGTKIKYVDPNWSNTRTGQVITGTTLTALSVAKVVSKWSGNNLVQSYTLAPDEKWPNFEAMNAKCPQSEWRDKFGKMVGPWDGQHCVYFIDKLYNVLTWPSPWDTKGSALCVSELIDQINLVRTIKGENVSPVCELGRILFPNSFNPHRQRPHLLNIVDWVRLGPEQTARALPAADDTSDATPEIAAPAPEGVPPEAQSVEKPTAAEVTGDSIPF